LPSDISVIYQDISVPLKKETMKHLSFYMQNSDGA
jgi:hypothetical protein